MMMMFWLVLLSDWSCHEGNLLQPIRSTTQILVVTCHRYGISALIPQKSFCGKNSGVVSVVLSGFLFKFNAWGSVFGFNTGICVRALGPFVVSSHQNSMKCLCKDCWVSKTCSVLKFSFLFLFGKTGKRYLYFVHVYCKPSTKCPPAHPALSNKALFFRALNPLLLPANRSQPN